MVTVNGLTQEPGTDYLVSGDIIYFSSFPALGDTIGIRFMAGNIGGSGGANTGNVTFNNINIIGDGNLHLQPDPANAGSYLDIFLTSGPDLHLVANDANLILGYDNGPNVMVGDVTNGNVYIQSWNYNTVTANTWIFGADGTLSFPNPLPDARSQIYTTNGGYQTVFEAFNINDGQGTGQKLTLDYDAAEVKIQTQTGTEWTFGQSGNLTTPGNVSLGGLLSAPQQTKLSNDPGTPGEICWDANYIYVCVATDTWKQSPLNSY
jgi:hypothetical protein